MSCPVVHFEIIGADGPALQQFYRELFGWQIQDMPEMSYGAIAPGEGGIGGGIGQEEGPAVRVYIQVDDLEAELTRIEANGGATVVPPMEIPGVVTFAMFRDPAGNTIGLVKNQGDAAASAT
ncbi:MAG: VOC family protein [Chloroflexia bacterium]|nr:VOC family protein [Chloroflexia bacterium]